MAFFTQVKPDAFKQLQTNAGLMLKNFNPSSPLDHEKVVDDIIATTSGGVSFQSNPTYQDLADGIDNAPANTMELKRLQSVEPHLSGTAVTLDADSAKLLLGGADVDTTAKLTTLKPRQIKAEDFNDIWFVGDYGDQNEGANAGYIAIHIMNALNTAGFQLSSTDKDKGNIAFDFQGHYSINDIDKLPFEIFIKEGTAQ